MRVIEAQCSWPWRLTITPNIKYVRTFPLEMACEALHNALPRKRPGRRSVRGMTVCPIALILKMSLALETAPEKRLHQEMTSGPQCGNSDREPEYDPYESRDAGSLRQGNCILSSGTVHQDPADPRE
jgi:hypothetical protein